MESWKKNKIKNCALLKQIKKKQNTCLWSVFIIPLVRPVSVFWVATGTSRRSLTGGTCPFAKQRKYLKKKDLKLFSI